MAKSVRITPSKPHTHTKARFTHTSSSCVLTGPWSCHSSSCPSRTGTSACPGVKCRSLTPAACWSSTGSRAAWGEFRGERTDRSDWRQRGAGSRDFVATLTSSGCRKERDILVHVLMRVLGFFYSWKGRNTDFKDKTFNSKIS